MKSDSFAKYNWFARQKLCGILDKETAGVLRPDKLIDEPMIILVLKPFFTRLSKPQLIQRGGK